jgi:hypothetical protein
MQMELGIKKDLGLQREVFDALPYAVVRDAFEGSFEVLSDLYTALVHIVPAGHQLKLLFLRVATQNANGAKFSIVQSNPTAAGATGTIEAFPVVGSVPSGVVDYPMVESAGAEVLRGSLEDPVQVLEGSVTFNIIYAFPAGTPCTGDRYIITYWGVEKIPE